MIKIPRLIAALVSLLALGIGAAQAENTKPEVKIGVIVPLTGDMAVHGVEIQRAMNLALGGIEPAKAHYSYRLIFEDNQLDGSKSVSAAQRLINIEKVDAVVTLWPPTASVVIPISEKANVLHYTIAWDPDLAKSHKLVLSHQAMVDAIAQSTLRLLKSEKKHRVAFLHMEEAGFNLGAKYIRELAPKEGIDIVADEAFNPKGNDFRSLIARTEQKSPDGYLIWTVMPSMDTLIRQIRSQKPEAFITGYFDYAQDTKQIQKTPYVSEMFASDAFIELYRHKYSESPISKGANAYDIVKLLVAAIENSPDKKPSAAELKTYLASIHDFPGAVGKFSINHEGNSTYSPVIRMAMGSERKLLSGGSEDNHAIQ